MITLEITGCSRKYENQAKSMPKFINQNFNICHDNCVKITNRETTSPPKTTQWLWINHETRYKHPMKELY